MATIKCRKCNGKHLTIKCEKRKPFHKKRPRNKKYNNFDNSKKLCVRISNLPNDINLRELNELLDGWGNIGRINIHNNKFNDTSAFIDFYDKEEAEYFVEALNKTPLDNLIIHVEILKS